MVGTIKVDLTTSLSNNFDPVPLIQAAKIQDWDKLRTLLEQGEQATVTSADGATALHWASYWDNIETAELLINSGANPNAMNDLGATALWNASLNGSEDMVGMLLRSGADPAISLVSGESPVMTAARTGSAKVVELLLTAGADPNATATRGQTALMWAAAQHHAAVVSVLLGHGADVHLRSETWSQVMAIPPHSNPANQQNVPHGNNTALLFAAREGDLASAKLLIAAGARVNDFNARGTSAIVLAAHSGYRDLVEFLLDVSADPDAAGAGFSALHLAIMRRDDGMARSLLEHGADPNAQVTNWTALRRASSDWHFHPALVGATSFWLAASIYPARHNASPSEPRSRSTLCAQRRLYRCCRNLWSCPQDREDNGINGSCRNGWASQDGSIHRPKSFRGGSANIGGSQASCGTRHRHQSRRSGGTDSSR